MNLAFNLEQSKNIPVNKSNNYTFLLFLILQNVADSTR